MASGPSSRSTNKEGLRREGGWLYGVREVLHVPIKKDTELDAALCDYAEQLRPEAAGGPRVRATRNSSRRVAAPSSLQTGTEGVAKAIPSSVPLADAGVLEKCDQWSFLYLGRKDMALYNELTYSTYARPGEALRMKAVDFVAKQPGLDEYKFSVIVLAPIERGEASKAGIYDEVLVLDDTRVPWLEELMLTHVPSEAARGRGCGHVELSSRWGSTSKRGGGLWPPWTSGIAQSPYQNRHGETVGDVGVIVRGTVSTAEAPTGAARRLCQMV